MMKLQMSLLAFMAMIALATAADNSFVCPAESGYWPHKNCWQFWQCSNGRPYEMTCAPGTQWAQELLTCDHITDCQRPPTELPSTEPESESTTSGSEPTTTEADSETSTAANDNETTTAAEEATSGAPSEAPSTAATTEADAESTTSESETSTAAEETTTSDEVSTGGSTEEPTTEASTSSSSEEPTQGPGSFKCPSESGYYPHENCWQYWQCGNWIAYEMTCAPGTQWDQPLLTCNHLDTCQRP